MTDRMQSKMNLLTKQLVPPVLALLLALLVGVLSLILSASPVPVQVVLQILHL